MFNHDSTGLGNDIKINKRDVDGILEWSKYYYTDAGHTVAARKIDSTENGGFYMLFDCQCDSTFTHLSKYDQFGNEEWYYSIPNSIQILAPDSILINQPEFSFITTRDQGVLLYGEGALGTVPWGITQVLIKLDEFGNVQWINSAAVQPNSNFSIHEGFASFVETANGDFIAAINIQDGNPYSSIMIRYNNLGDTLWTSNVFQGITIVNLYEEANGNYIVLFDEPGTSANRIVRYDSNLNELWTAHGFEIDVGLIELKIKSNGNYAILHDRIFDIGSPTHYWGILNLDVNGNLLWDDIIRFWPQVTHFVSTSTNFHQVGENCYVIGGANRSPGVLDPWESFLLEYSHYPTASLEEEKIKPNLNVFPNPTNNVLNVNSTNLQNLKFTVYSVDGKMMISGKINESNEINLSQLESGIYIVKFSSNEYEDSVRIIKY